MLFYSKSMDYILTFLQVITFYHYMQKYEGLLYRLQKSIDITETYVQLHHKKHIFSNLTLTLLIAEVERFMAVRVGDFSSRRIGGPLDFLSSISL